jgi:hypothetical protein
VIGQRGRRTSHSDLVVTYARAAPREIRTSEYEWCLEIAVRTTPEGLGKLIAVASDPVSR